MTQKEKTQAQIELCIIQWNAIVKHTRTKAFRQLRDTEPEVWQTKLDLAQDKLDTILAEWDALARSIGGSVEIHYTNL